MEFEINKKNNKKTKKKQLKRNKNASINGSRY